MMQRIAARFSLRLRVFLFFALIGAGGLALGIGALVAAGWDAPAETRHALALWGGGAAAATLGLVVWVWLMFDEHVARPVERIGRAALAAAHGGAPGVDARSAAYLGPLGDGAAAAAGALAEARARTAAAVEAATEEAARRRRQLETVLRDLNHAVTLCTLEHRVLLYNARAAALLERCGVVGLGRSLLEVLAAQPIEHALESVRRRFEEGRWRDRPDGLSTPFVVATADGRMTLQGRLTLMPDPDQASASGYIVTFEDATGAHEARLRRDRALLQGLGEVEAALAEPGRAREALARVAAEAAALSAADWPKADVYSTTLWTSIIRRRTGAQNFSAEIVGEPCWLRCDSVGVVEMLDTLLNRLADALGVRAFSLSATPRRIGLVGPGGIAEARVTLRLGWRGPAAPQALLDGWLREPLDAAIGGATPAELLAAHLSRLETVDGPDAEAHALELALSGPSNAHLATPARAPARPEFYDFDLLDRPLAADAHPEAPLRALSYVVFDTETTGLEPARGDRIVQIAGVRIVNGRVLKGERFDELVNPGRRIPVAATRIHGVDNRMVAEAPPAAEVLRRFHAFCAGAVLVAHNAAFDMRFLAQEAPEGGPRFDHAVLDTVLLAAHLNGQDDSLTLDALAERFAVDLPAASRHTALGDSLATAEVFLRLVDMLEARGVATLGEAIAASRGPAAIRRRQAAY
ncbi:3'-5' exonuclease [Rubrimonas cliftonensis]|uniref:DNA-directed DNA polymerase n=1 Tax=Rubrimonas cliftonensis TaxID=89524 RepID=A0A1H3W560_9RHOB|nr:3'-5' exonuclease [Rubrimonas cliftonensis]SDZ82259.1 DNA polymerase-3 subunit epsilon [Rubrimonas cliftonensis]